MRIYRCRSCGAEQYRLFVTEGYPMTEECQNCGERTALVPLRGDPHVRESEGTMPTCARPAPARA